MLSFALWCYKDSGWKTVLSISFGFFMRSSNLIIAYLLSNYIGIMPCNSFPLLFLLFIYNLSLLEHTSWAIDLHKPTSVATRAYGQHAQSSLPTSSPSAGQVRSSPSDEQILSPECSAQALPRALKSSLSQMVILQCTLDSLQVLQHDSHMR